MKTFTNLVLAIVSLHAVAGLASAAPQDAGQPASAGCAIPEVAFVGLPKPFTLTALIDEKSSAKQKQWPVQLTPRVLMEQKSSRPVLSNTRIAQPEFKLVGGKLVYEGIAATFQNSIATFPPPLQSFVWYVNSAKQPGRFIAGYGCDEDDNQILVLSSDDSMTFNFLTPLSLLTMVFGTFWPAF